MLFFLFSAAGDGREEGYFVAVFYGGIKFGHVLIDGAAQVFDGGQLVAPLADQPVAQAADGGDAGRQIDGFAGQAEEYGRSTAGQFEQAKIQLGELTESAGTLLLPMVTRIATEGVALLEKFSGWFEANRPQIESALSGIGTAFTTMSGYFMQGLETIWPLLQSVVNFLLDNKPILIAALTAIGIAVTASFGPVGVAVVAITAFITLLGYLRDHWQEVLSAVIGFVENHAGMISAIFGPAGTLLVLFVQFRDTLGMIFEWIKTAIGLVGSARPR